MAYVPNSGSTVAFQSDPTKLVGTVSVVGAIGISGSPSISGTVNVGNLPVNQSVSGMVDVGNFPITQNVSGSVATFLGGSTNASVITVSSPISNQSVSGTVSVGNFPTTQNISGSVFATGSVTALQGTNPWFNQIVGSVAAVQSGTWATSMVGVASVSQAGNWIFQPQSVSGAGTFNINPVGSGSIIATLINSSVATLQGTNPWIVQLTSGSVITAGGNSSVQVVGTVPPSSVSGVGLFNVNPTGNGSVITVSQGSVAAAQSGVWNLFIAGSVATVGTPAANQSVSGTVNVVPQPASVSGVGIFNIAGSVATTGSVTTLQGTNPWFVQTTGSVLNQYREDVEATSVVGIPMVYRRNSSTSMMGVVSPTTPLPIVGSVSGAVSISNFPTTQNISGSVFAVGSVTTLQGTNPWVVSNSSVAVMSVAPHSVAALQGTNPWVIGNSSVMLTTGTNVVGSVAVLQGSSPWLVTGSVLAVMVDGSASIVGTYAEDIAHITGDKGLFVLQVRNDAMTSVTTATGEYSPIAGGPIGETIIANAPINRWVTGFASITSGADTPVILAGGASIFTYVTSAQISMAPGPVNQVSFKNSAGGAILSRMYLPSSTAGISLVFRNPLKTLTNAAFIASIAAIGSVMVNVQGFRSNFDV